MKVGIIGAGAVGSACLLSLVTGQVAREIVLVNRTRARAEGMVADLQYGATLGTTVDLTAGDYADLKGADVVLITAGVNEKDGGATDRDDTDGRLRLLEENAKVYRDIVPQIVAAAPDAVLLVVTDPPDPLAELALNLAGHDKVVSSGTFLDTQRLKFHVARYLGVHASAVEGLVLGEHGTSQVFVWSSVRIAGIPLMDVLGYGEEQCEKFQKEIEEEVRHANITIIEGTGASQLGIGVVAARLTRAILYDERLVLPVGSHVPEYGTTLSVPSIVGRQGIVRRLTPHLSESEKQLLAESARKIAQSMKDAC
ncbi:NAD(P)-binding domain-containing protein [Paenalcaligenes niemegkensis]|uniref:malate dehydrogenase n=1 Tax=Paenalcaligenes niemegkensis TaxID=2895469 RepID=UPI001EE7EDD0|nr:NAD(P)-binding domain-containing protein [Paenalcaligenes niemegkensis]MCQ9617090.1 NAD(P)-binding domain-containing protein [Paenalcaligenes niemegkensis]